jgi:hypothetical protein
MKIIVIDGDDEVIVDEETIIAAWLGMLSDEERGELMRRALALQRQVNDQLVAATDHHQQDLIVRIALSHLIRPRPNGHMPSS